MTTTAVRLAKPEDREAWNEFVGRHPEATYCHWFEWQTVVRRTYGKSCPYLVSQEGTTWTGVLPLVHMQGRLGGKRLVSMPFLDQGGIVAASTSAAEALWRAALELLAERRAKGLELRGGHLPGGTQDRHRTNRYRFLLPLDGGEERVWGSVGAKVRNQIRKSQKEGLTTTIADAAEVALFYEVFRRNMHDLGSPVHSRALFEEIFDVLGSRARLYLTRDAAGKAVGGGIALRFKDTVVVPWASSLRAARPACPNHSLYWKVLQDAVAGGARLFDFGRSSVGTGTYHFKKQWGATLKPLHWSLLDCRGEHLAVGHLSAHRNARLAAIWKRLPSAFTTWLGPRIRGRLPN